MTPDVPDRLYPSIEGPTAIYGDCDEFYQHNVQYARDKIAEYEKEFPAAIEEDVNS